MNTKEKILVKARAIFNEKGINTTTLRQIAGALNISQGNLNYHFKTKQAIVEALYFELVEKSNQEMELLEEGRDLMGLFHQISSGSMALLYAYRFLLRDWYFVFRKSSIIKAHYTDLYLLRKGQFAVFVEKMIAEGILRPEAFPEEYERFFERMNIMTDNWINDFETVNADKMAPLAYYQKLIFEMIYPYLTKKGTEHYASLMH